MKRIRFLSGGWPIVGAALGAVSVLVSGCLSSHPGLSQRQAGSIRAALTFHASFDTSTDADYARGDARLHSAPKWGQPRVVHAGGPPGNTVHSDPGAGRFGGALRFERKIDELVAYRADGNVGYRTGHWGGAVSYWLRVSPDEDLAPGYCDTLQITTKDWNDASFFNDFTKDEKPREFRLGAFADRSVWDPTQRDWEKIPSTEKPLVTLKRTPFTRDRWTHVVFTWDNYNTGQKTGITRFYLDGQFVGELPPTQQTYTWDAEKGLIMLGLGYTGWMDDLAIFNRRLSDKEVEQLYRLPKGVKSLF